MIFTASNDHTDHAGSALSRKLVCVRQDGDVLLVTLSDVVVSWVNTSSLLAQSESLSTFQFFISLARTVSFILSLSESSALFFFILSLFSTSVSECFVLPLSPFFSHHCTPNHLISPCLPSQIHPPLSLSSFMTSSSLSSGLSTW